MKKYLKRALSVLFVTMLLLGGTSAYTIMKLQSYAKLINYVGIVRGASQRIVKLELNHEPDDILIQYVDNILKELKGEKGSYGLPCPDDEDYRKDLTELNHIWDEVKIQMKQYRSDQKNGPQLLALSETCFTKANDTVFSAETYMNKRIHRLMMVWAGMMVSMLLVWLFIFWAASKRMLGLESANRELEDITKRDPLTGVYQFAYFKEKSQRMLEEHPTYKYALVYTDFTDFKYINDVFGYSYGDRILSRYGAILHEGLKEGEVCGRVTADDFVLLLQYENRADIEARQRIADHLISEFMLNEHEHQVVPSCCGICCIEDVREKLNIGGYIDRANLARGTVKNGTNLNYMYYNEEIRDHLMEEKNLESHMHDALKNREFIVVYQPKVNLQTGKIASAEALIRWKRNDNTMIPPDVFIPLFEKKFMINQLDQYVVEEVCKWLRHLLDQGIPALPVAVNVSRLQFYDHNFVKRYVQIRDQYRIPPELLEIEFTESIVFDNTNKLEDIVKELKSNHFRCAIDDFGKGYSSLSLLKNLSMDYLKIDRYFFIEGEDSTRDLALVKGIINMVHQLHMKAIAEGIEDIKQAEQLKEIGCDYIQGYVYYRPMSQNAYEELLQTNNIKAFVKG